MKLKLYPDEAVIILVLGVILGMFMMVATPPISQPPRTLFILSHATQCRHLYAIAHTHSQAHLVQAACAHENPDRWLAQFTLAECTEAKHER